ncbi:peroxisomal membrane protein PMP34-like [Ptychodera flava]|uniref:peroxisomal membrane protein PMP34-like n=1 Tax=Ptychodera flava TaxID=63121 RepID=UPI00396A825D
MATAAASSSVPLFSYDSLVHALAGATGSATAMTAFYPLDAARVRLQVDDKRQARHTPHVIAEIIQEEGVGSLYRGLVPVLQSLYCSNFVYFYAYNSLKMMTYGGNRKPGAAKDLAIGFIAGVINVLVTTPLWVANTRLKLQGVVMKSKIDKEIRHPKYNGMVDALRRIYSEEGVQSLWSGTVPSLFLVANPSIQFAVYEALKRWQRRHSSELSGLTIFLMGAVAKATATVATYPLQVIQSRRRYHGDKENDGKRQSFLEMVINLFKTQNIRGLYKGLEAKLLQTVLMAALMFLTYEKIAAFVFTVMRVKPIAKKH